MAENTHDKKSVVSYLKAQTHLNHALEFDFSKGVLSDASATSRRSILQADCHGDGGFATQFAPYVGPGALSALSVDAEDDAGSQMPGICLIDAETTVDKSQDIQTKIRLEMDDIIWRENSSAERYPEFGAGFILILKICGSLASNYDPQTVARVGKLVQNNTMTAVHDVPESEDTVEMERDPEDKVDRLLDALLDQSKPRKRTVHMNSNEPVLLINNAGRVGEVEFGTIVTHTIEQLQRQWNIWPVRIYAGRFLESGDADFSISLLNVTNTDLGGPSMIQLLDAPCEARGWLGYARREVWNGRELLEKDERQHEPLIETPIQEPVTEAEEAFKVDAAQIPVPLEKGDELEESTADADEVLEPSPQGNLVKETTEPPEAEEDHMQEDIRQHFKPDVASIKHPTWNHRSESESLLDLIKSQSSALLEASEDQDEESKVPARLGTAQQSGSGSDDEFVVV